MPSLIRKTLIAALALAPLYFVSATGATAATAAIEKATAEEEKLFKQVFPQADVFSKKEGTRPHNKAYKKDPATGDTTLLGFVFMTNDIEPEEWGYAGPIEILVGMTTAGEITAIRVIYHREPFGSFSIATPEFAAQFVGKSVRDAFEVGRDIDAVTRATISVDGASRVVKKSARRVLQQYLAEQQGQK